MGLGQAGKKLSCAQSTDWITPIPRNLRNGSQHKSAFAKRRVRNCKVRHSISPAIPQHDVEIEDPRAPAPAHTAAAKTVFNALQMPEHSFWIALCAHQTGPVGVTSVRRTHGRCFDNRSAGQNVPPFAVERRHGRRQYPARRTEMRVPHIGAERDKVELPAQGVRYPARFVRRAADGDHGRSPYLHGGWPPGTDRR